MVAVREHPIALAEEVLGQQIFGLDGQETDFLESVEPLLEDGQQARHLIYVGALRALAEQRYADRTQSDSLDVASWRPTDEQTKDIRARLAPAITRLSILNNIDRSLQVAGIDQRGFRPHQALPFEHTVECIRRIPNDARKAGDPLGLRARIEAATGTGKTYILAKTAQVMQLGHAVKAVVAVPRHNLIEQTRERFSKFAPDLHVTTQFDTPDVRQLPGGVHIITHTNLLSLHKKGLFPPPGVGVLFLDEAHMLLGRKIRRAVDETKNLISIGYTGSPELLADSVSSLLPHRIYEDDLRGCIEAGILRSVQLLPIVTGEVLTLTKRYGDYSVAELAQLAPNTKRNGYIVDLARYFVEDGRQTYISCLPGDKCAHARFLEEELAKDEYRIVDKVSGEKRNLRVAAVDGMMPKDVVREKKELWERGELDILLDTQLLSVGWDTDRIGAMILASPTRSQAIVRQRLGRGLRPNQHSPGNSPLIVAELIDVLEGKQTRQQYTCWELLEETSVEFGRIIGREQNSSPAESTKLLESLPQSIVPLVQKVDQLLVGGHRVEALKEYAEVPHGWVPVGQIITLAGRAGKLSLSSRSVRIILENEAGMHCILAGKNRPYYFAPPEAIAFMKKYKGLTPPPPGFVTANRLSAMHGYNHKRVRDTAVRLGIAGTFHHSQGSAVGREHFSPNQQERIVAAMEERLPPLEGEMGESELSDELGIAQSTLSIFFASQGIRGTVRYTTKGNNTQTICYSPEAIALARREFLEDAMPSNGVLLNDLAKEFGVTRQTLNKMIERASLSLYVKLARSQGNAMRKHYVDPEVADIIRQRAVTMQAPAGSMQVGTFAKEWKITYGKALSLIEEHELTDHIHKIWDGTRYTFYIDAEALKLLNSLARAYTSGHLPQAPRRVGDEVVTRRLNRPAMPPYTGMLVEVPRALQSLRCSEDAFRVLLERTNTRNALVHDGDGWFVYSDFLRRVARHCKDLPAAPPGWLSLSIAAKELHVETDWLRHRLKSINHSSEVYKDHGGYDRTVSVHLYVNPQALLSVAKELKNEARALHGEAAAEEQSRPRGFGLGGVSGG